MVDKCACIEMFFLLSLEDLTLSKTNHLNLARLNKIKQNPLKLTSLSNELKQPLSRKVEILDLSSLLVAITYNHFARQVTSV